MRESIIQRQILVFTAAIIALIVVGGAVLMMGDEVPSPLQQLMFGGTIGGIMFLIFAMLSLIALAGLVVLATIPFVIGKAEAYPEVRFHVARVFIFGTLGAIAAAVNTVVLWPGADWPGAIIFLFLAAVAFFSLPACLVSHFRGAPADRDRWFRIGLLAIFLVSCLSLIVFSAIGLCTRNEGKQSRGRGEIGCVNQVCIIRSKRRAPPPMFHSTIRGRSMTPCVES